MSMEVNSEKLSSLSIADLSCLIELFELQMDGLEGLSEGRSVEEYYTLMDMKKACNVRLKDLINDIFIY